MSGEGAMQQETRTFVLDTPMKVLYTPASARYTDESVLDTPPVADVA